MYAHIPAHLSRCRVAQAQDSTCSEAEVAFHKTQRREKDAFNVAEAVPYTTHIVRSFRCGQPGANDPVETRAKHTNEYECL